MEIINGLLCRKFSIGYFPIPKVANTSIKHIIYRMEFGESFSPEQHPSVIHHKSWLAKKLIKPMSGPPIYKHIHDYYRKNLVNITEADFQFTIIRDPVKRFLSAYSNRVLHYKELSFEKINALSEFKKKQINFDGFIYDPNISQFIENIETYLKVPAINMHVRPISTLISNLNSFTEVYPIESIPLLEEKLSSITNSIINIPKHQTGGYKIAISKLNLNHLDKVIKMYQNDYLLLSNYYSADDIRKEWEI